jgi:N6-L-threonylcarbamoyladenine synthase
MKILAIETSCDETALAIISAQGGLQKPGFRILENLVASQIKIHRPFGGVVPNLAKREHIKNLPILLARIMNNELRIKNKQTIIHNSKFIIPDIIAVTVGPGLEPCLWTGINFAKDLAKKLDKPLIGVNHLKGHLYSFLLSQKPKTLFPAIALIVSGGHTILLLMKNLTVWKKLGETRDDAAGEAFDKVARLLNLPYPGGPFLEKLANYGSSTSIDFPRPMIYQKNYDFSFSGLKTAVLYYLRDNVLKTKNYSPRFAGEAGKLKANIATSFQQAVIDVLLSKTFRASQEFKAKSIFLSGGVAANKALQKEFKLKIKNLKLKINFLVPPKNFETDNAAMTGVAAYFDYLKNKKLRLVAQPNLNL